MLDAVGSQTKLSWGLCRPANQKTSGAARSSLHSAGNTKRSAAERRATERGQKTEAECARVRRRAERLL